MLAAVYVLQFVSVMLVLGCESHGPAADASHPSPQAQPADKPARRPEPNSGETQARSGREASTRLCLELQAPREQVQLGEPFSLVASLINCSSLPQQVDDLLSPEFGFLQIWIQPPDGKETLYRPMVKREGRGSPMRTLAPGERLSALAPVYVGADGWTLTQPGRYRFRAQYALGATRMESKSVEVAVTSPKSNADREAARLIMSREASRLLASGRDENGEGRKGLAILAQQYPESRLAPYARVGLATADSVDRFDPYTKSFQKGQCERATEQFARTVPEIGDPSVAASATASWVRCLRQLGREKDVNAAISTLLRTHPTTKDVNTVTRMLGATRRE